MSTQAKAHQKPTPAQREEHVRWLREVSTIPTAAGHEDRVIKWIQRWLDERDEVAIDRDEFGNITLSLKNADTSSPPVYFTAHLDHPAFVVERIVAPATLELAFRGGVMADYFDDAKITIHTAEGTTHSATLTGLTDAPAGSPFKHYLADLQDDNNTDSNTIRPGDIAVWELPGFELTDQGIVHTNACDDLAAVAAALSAFDTVRLNAEQGGAAPPDARILFTLSEEVGFVGAIGACRAKTIPENARVLALENSRAFPESPIGGGPIVRVGDRISVFSPRLTTAVTKVAESIAGGSATPNAQQKQTDMPSWKWQRKLMAGGACEATVFCAAGLEATCICLPLGNYHNMADLDAVQAGQNTTKPRVGREFIALADYHGMIDLLIACASGLDETPAVNQMIDKLWNERAFVLGAEHTPS